MSLDHLSVPLCDVGPLQLKLGSGNFARVFEVVYQKRRVVCKIMKHAIDPLLFYNEIYILHLLQNCVSIPKLIGFVESEFRLMILMEKIPGITLQDMICFQGISYNNILDITRQVVYALRHVHSLRILHRDIKPSNIIVDPVTNNVCIIDFGLSTILPSTHSLIEGVCGTPGFMSPEIVYDKPYGLPADVYALGVTLYVLCTRRFPETYVNMQRYIRRIRPREISDIVQQCLSRDTIQRPTLTDILSNLDKVESNNVSCFTQICSIFRFCC